MKNDKIAREILKNSPMIMNIVIDDDYDNWNWYGFIVIVILEFF